MPLSHREQFLIPPHENIWEGHEELLIPDNEVIPKRNEQDLRNIVAFHGENIERRLEEALEGALGGAPEFPYGPKINELRNRQIAAAERAKRNIANFLPEGENITVLTDSKPVQATASESTFPEQTDLLGSEIEIPEESSEVKLR